MADRNLVFLGGVDSGKSMLVDLIIGEEMGVRREFGGVEVTVVSPDRSTTCLRIFETNQENLAMCV